MVAQLERAMPCPERHCIGSLLDRGDGLGPRCTLCSRGPRSPVPVIGGSDGASALTPAEHRVYGLLCREPNWRIDDLAEYLAVARSTAYWYVSQIRRKGHMKEVENGNRYR